MRALCGAIITAGALIGLGLFAIGMGMRYQSLPADTPAAGAADTQVQPREVRFRELDNPMKVTITLLIVSLVIGLAVAFLGLAFHHERRLWEREHPLGQYPAAPSVGSTPAPRMPTT